MIDSNLYMECTLKVQLNNSPKKHSHNLVNCFVNIVYVVVGRILPRNSVTKQSLGVESIVIN